MTKRNEIYRCELCGNIVSVLHAGEGELVCCGEPMTLLAGNTVDAAKEKHVPVIEKTEHGVKVSVGSTLHPMEDKHYIVWIEIIADGEVHRKFLNPGDAPVAEFCDCSMEAKQIIAREYCNLHGLWQAEN